MVLSFEDFLLPAAKCGENLIDLVPAALQAHLHRPVRIVAGGAGEIDRLLLDHGLEATFWIAAPVMVAVTACC
jgi:hypothetical protein